ncbi:von Willebrand factor [Spea bombifrons]|uniref:von Willebrand factor n=1 Tax=Spea bombifrons TaxID=233779 RepID=UPI00234A3469|nr:von Willebrand factor [Spea bombifrons]
MNFLQLLALWLVSILTPGIFSPLVAEGKLDWSMLSRCSLFGGSHVRTFDGTFYDFLGDCSYMLAGDCHRHSFSLLVDYRNGKRKSVSMYLGEYFDIHVFLDGTATEGEKSISMPYASNGIFLETEAGYYKLSSQEHGFMVKIDTSGNVQVVLSNKLSNKTCGLCGNFNQLAEDDFMTQEGIMAEKSHEFANSWAMHGGEKRCKRVYPPNNTCNITSETAEKGFLQRCELLKTSSTFMKCHHVVDPDPYVAICEDDMCTCAEDMNCPCETFLEYARTCAQHGVIMNSWATHTACKPQCPPGMEYNECVTPCVKTCQSLDINEVCQEQCLDGCSCPEGKVLDGDRCIDASECSCIHSGKRYPVGSTIHRDCNTCTCNRGLWECSSEDCPGECFVTGQSHFKSFDNKHFTFSGICHYLLAKDTMDNSFSVVIETVQCADDPDAVCIRSASVRLQDMQNITVKLKHGGVVSLDGQDVLLPLLHGPLRIQTTVMSSVRLSYKDDLQIDWDGHGKLLVKVSPTYSDYTSGLCGNYNGNQGDDFLSPSGLVEASVEDFGNSWKLSGDCTDLLKQDRDPCSLNPKRARYAEDVCFAIMTSIFQPCHHEVNPAPYLKNCRYDVCSCADGKECMCSALSTYAIACSRKGIVIDWRTPEFCPVKCSEGKIYQQCGSPCNQTCRSLSLPDTDCKEFCMEGCYCPPGLHVNEYNECVPKSECSCYYDGELFQPDDIFSNHHSMCYCENGLMHCSTNEVPGAYFSDDFFAQEYRPSARVKRSLTCRPPLDRFICPANDPKATGLECAKTCQNYELECMSHGCVSGCMCPKGWVRHNSKCVVPERCPCFHAGKEYAPGEDVKIDCNTCVCENRKWQCTKNVCDATCSAIGAAHYITFDGLKYAFPGNCQYVLVQDYCNGGTGTFRILIENEGCGLSLEKCSKKIIILFRNGEIYLADEQVHIKTPPRDDTNIEVLQSGKYFILILGNEMYITWDKGTRIYVTLKEQYKDKVCGLCGNFDGIENNDLTSSNNQVEINPSDFGNSWKVNPLCADAAKFTTEKALSLCEQNLMKHVTVENACDILTGEIFAECAKAVNPEPYWEICVYDTCSCESIGDCACFCDSIAAYAHACAQKGVNVHWRTSHLCPQSCEEKNKKELEYVCEWRYNSCASACPVTCQHPEKVDCPLKCVEGCHAYCPPGKILDEVSESCVHPSECPVCVVEGRHIPHGQKVILNRDDPLRCQSCHCEGRNLQCTDCPVDIITTPSPTLQPHDLTTTLEPIVEEGTYECNKMMDLAFLVDGSSKLSESDFETVKAFIVGIMEKIHISQKRIRVSVVQYHSLSTPKLFGLNENKKLSELVKKVKNMKYFGSPTSSTFEALKYVSHYVFPEAPRDNAPKIAVLLTASSSPKSISSLMKTIMKRKITVIPVAIGPHVKMDDINLIKSKSPMNKPFILDSASELLDRRDEIIDYLCDLAPDPTRAPVLFPAPTKPPSITTPQVKATIPPIKLVPKPSPKDGVIDIVFIVEGSDKVGEVNFNKTKTFLENVIQGMDISEETIHITIIQYSFTIIVEYTFTERQSKKDIIESIREMKFRGGNATNTGKAINYVSEQTFTTKTGSRDQVSHLAYLVTSTPPSDVITQVDSSINFVPIAVGSDIDIREFDLITSRDKVIKIDDYTLLINEAPDLVLETCCLSQHIKPTVSLQTVQCVKPMDVIFILDGGSNVSPPQFEEMKTFVKTFINKVDIGYDATQVAVLQYGMTNTLEIAWTDPQDKASLLHALNNIQKREEGPGRIGEALIFAVQSAISEVHGGRPIASKVVVMVITDRSYDQVDAAAETAAANRISVFPIGVGPRYDEDELKVLAGPSANDKIIKLQLTEDLPTMMMVNNDFIRKLCTGLDKVCIDDDGNKRKHGETWMLKDTCHSVTCMSDGTMSMVSRKVNCEKIPKPSCHNNLPAVKIEETCGCRWTCPCMCIGSSTRHIGTFDGLEFKLLGNCSYVLFDDKEHDLQVILQNGECRSINHQICMKYIEVKYKQDSIQLLHTMQVSVNGKMVSIPYKNNNFEVTHYEVVIHEIKIPSLGFLFSFTPMNNEFMLQLNPSAFSLKMSGLCGICDQNPINDFTLADGSITTDNSRFIKDWTVHDTLGRTCETKLDDPCTEPVSAQCDIMLSAIFEECHKKISPSTYYQTCRETSCHGQDPCEVIATYSHICRIHGECVDWRKPGFCAMECPTSMVYNHCRLGCNKECGNTSNGVQCSHHPTEGCFCPEGDVLMNGRCVSENVCSQCTDEYGEDHQHLERWIPINDPCGLCICLDNRTINCTSRPCPSIEPITCGPCEFPRLKTTSKNCCPEYECVCDKTCDVTPVPHCENGLVPILTNPGQCKALYQCVCKKETCAYEKHRPSCPPYKELTLKETQCCDEYECVCSCTNSTVTCPVGYISSFFTNECGCTSVTCHPDKVCVYKNNAHSVGSSWEDGCMTCSCTDMEDSVTQLHVVECLEKRCKKDCDPGFTYIKKNNECCGKCVRTVCEQTFKLRGQGDFDMPQDKIRYYNVGSSWKSPYDPCIINECVQVNDEVFVLEKNVSCSDINAKKCSVGYELVCMQGSECCPMCHCEPIPGCPLNGTIIGPSETMMIDECTTCECSMKSGPILSYKLTCRKTTCQPCPPNSVLQKVSGSCCGKCVSIACPATLRNGTTVFVKPNESIKDGCDFYSCKINDLGELTREKKVTTCPPFNREKCLADGGKIKELDNSCCETCVEPECRQTTGILKYIRVDDCLTERQVNIQYCEGKCTSKSVYAIETHSMEDQCVCCSAIQTESLQVSLRCPNGTIVQHEVLQAKNCECVSHKCTN